MDQVPTADILKGRRRHRRSISAAIRDGALTSRTVFGYHAQSRRRDREQSFDGAGETGREHPPVNFHAFAACTGGTFQRETARAIAQNTPSPAPTAR